MMIMALDRPPALLKPCKPSVFLEQFPKDIAPSHHHHSSPSTSPIQTASTAEQNAKRRRKERYRQNRERYRTTPVTFDEIQEVDEEGNHENGIQSHRLWDYGQSSPYARSREESERRRGQACLSQPNPKNGKRHHRSQESLLAMHAQQSLPTIPEITSPTSDTTAEQSLEKALEDDFVPGSLPRTFTLP